MAWLDNVQNDIENYLAASLQCVDIMNEAMANRDHDAFYNVQMLIALYRGVSIMLNKAALIEGRITEYRED